MVLLEEAACLLKCHGYTEIKLKMKGKKNSHLNNELARVSSEPRSSDNEKKHSQILCSAFTTKLEPHVCHVTSHSGSFLEEEESLFHGATSKNPEGTPEKLALRINHPRDNLWGQMVHRVLHLNFKTIAHIHTKLEAEPAFHPSFLSLFIFQCSPWLKEALRTHGSR